MLENVICVFYGDKLLIRIVVLVLFLIDHFKIVETFKYVEFEFILF